MTLRLFEPWLSIPVRIFLGAVFLYSAWPKLADPPAFAQMVWNYRLLPEAAVHPLAITLPWVELLAGWALVTGFFRRGAALVTGLLLIVFTAALGINLSRGVAVDCGCFSVGEAAGTDADRFATMQIDLLRDLGLLVLAAHALVSPVTWRREGRRAAEPPEKPPAGLPDPPA